MEKNEVKINNSQQRGAKRKGKLLTGNIFEAGWGDGERHSNDSKKPETKTKSQPNCIETKLEPKRTPKFFQMNKPKEQQKHLKQQQHKKAKRAWLLPSSGQLSALHIGQDWGKHWLSNGQQTEYVCACVCSCVCILA